MIMENSEKLWTGEVPNNWKFYKGKYIFGERSERGNSVNLQLLSPTQKFGVIPQSMYDELTSMKSVKVKEDTDLSTFKTIHKGDFCISLRSFQGGFEYSEYEGVVSPAYHVLYPKMDICAGYYKYLFKEQRFIGEMNSHCQSLRDGKNISYFDFGRTLIPFPPLSKQQAIADYLDETCSKIDEIIAEAKASIDEYKELKIGQINKYTVHKMKRTKLKYITEKIGDGIHATPKYSDEGTIRFINGGSFGEDSIKMIGPMLSNEEYQKQNKSLLNEHTVMIALNGANFGNTSLYSNETILLGKSAGYITLKSTVCREYVRYCLENSVTKESFDLSLNGTTIPNLSLNTLRNTEICLPDYSVQKQLAKTIKKMIIKMDSLIAEKQSLINDLEAYKKSLIYEVVTGKRRVV